MNIDQAKAIAIVEILARLGIHPKRTAADKLLYLSPVRKEKTPSFWVYTKTNRWHDYGDGRGGDPVDFASAYLQFTRESHTISDALRWIGNMGVASHDIAPVHRPHDQLINNDSPLMLKSKKQIQHVGLIHYLDKRGIPHNIARRHLKELRVHNTRTNKYFTALGFPNEEGGFELRNPFFKGCLRPKAISFIRGKIPKPEGIHLFEGFMDYLSAITQLRGNGLADDAIILNSLSCLKQAIAYMQNYGYRVAYSWMDNDEAGAKATTLLTEFCQTQADLRHTPMNKVYTPHKDVNAWHMHQLKLTL
ncbi:toprim domain-containing protein [Spirosoma sp. BT702]|uniref:Toprim domain-containing protein n=1 Tax=Spirosoma profusum TaxID=2771354 RepID=A0A927G9T4_9BACT|nr:toprim domain-containing protein [Spirosoma profusum]MBD2704828.1 toprim domain-containing protein [Spirosoma profusum]